MKKKVGIVLLLLFGFLLFVLIRFVFLEKQNTWGKLKVVASPTASIFINNVAVSKVPYEDKYKAGEYILKLIPEGNATSTASWQRKITIYKNAQTYVTAELGSSDITTSVDILSTFKTSKILPGNKGEISIETEPSGAIIYLDNDEKGVAPSVLADVPVGDHELSIFMPGFFRRTKKINMVAGYRINAYIKLAVDPVQSPSFKAEDTIKEASDSASSSSSSTPLKNGIIVRGTPEGTLNVREEASVTATKSATVKEGDTFEVLEDKNGWYRIEYEKGKQGWISSEYTRKQE